MTFSKIALIYDKNAKNYKINIPFNPPDEYPELSRFNFDIDPYNRIYSMVRNVFIKLKLDEENLGNHNWNPLSEFISEGDNVLIKPNLVKDYHRLEINGVLSQITNATVLRPLIDYILIALNRSGSIIIADTPLEKTDFNKVVRINKIFDLCKFYKRHLNINIKLHDLRTWKRKRTNRGHFLLEKIELKGPPKGFFEIDLKDNSLFNEFDNKQQNYCTLADHEFNRENPRSKKVCNTNKYHSSGTHIYKIPKIVLESDVIISVPKFKTHRLSGITLNLKNMIGICEKIYLPHFRLGAPPLGDAYPIEPPTRDIVKKKLKKNFNKIRESVRTLLIQIPFLNYILRLLYDYLVGKIELDYDWWGAWYGNDTLWRTIHDLNRILFFCDKEGKLRDVKQRKYFSIIDGIISQEGEGPMSGTPINTKFIIGSRDPLASDTFSAHIMGYDVNMLKVISESKNIKNYIIGESDLKNIEIISNIKRPMEINLNFKVPKGFTQIKKN